MYWENIGNSYPKAVFQNMVYDYNFIRSTILLYIYIKKKNSGKKKNVFTYLLSVKYTEQMEFLFK